MCGRFVTSTISYCDNNIDKIKTSPFLSLNDSIEECSRCMFIAHVPLFGWDFV